MTEEQKNTETKATYEEKADAFTEAFANIEKLEKKENDDIRDNVSGDDVNNSDDNIEQEFIAEEKSVEKPEKKRTTKEKRRYFQAVAEKEKLALENEELKQKLANTHDLLNDSIHSSTYNYGKNAYSELERAKAAKKAAIEEGDIDALLEADIVFSKATSAVNELEKWAEAEERQAQTNQQYYEQNALQEQMQPEYAPDLTSQIMHQWLIEHPEVNTESRRYNPQVANEMANFIEKLDGDIAASNRHNDFLSAEYFDKVESHFDKVNKYFNKNSRGSSKGSPVGAVRSGAPSINKVKPKEVRLTQNEVTMAHNAGVDPEVWRKYKIKELEKKNDK